MILLCDAIFKVDYLMIDCKQSIQNIFDHLYETRHVKRGIQTLILRCFSCDSHEGPIISLHRVKRILPHIKDDLCN